MGLPEGEKENGDLTNQNNCIYIIVGYYWEEPLEERM
jgi:hypothetical protein